MPVGYQTNPLNRQTINTLATPGIQKMAASPGSSPSPLPGTGTHSTLPGQFAAPGTSSYSFPSSSIQPQQQAQPPSTEQTNALGGGESTGMPPSMSQYANSSNISTLLRALTGNKDRI